MKTREEIEKKVLELWKSHIKMVTKFGGQIEYKHVDDYMSVINAVRFIDFLTGDDQRERWECKNCEEDIGCVQLKPKGERPFPTACNSNWKKVGA